MVKNIHKHFDSGDLTSELVRAGRMLLRWEQGELADKAGVPLPTLSKLEMRPGALSTRGGTADRLFQALRSAGVEFIPENGGGAGVRLRK